MPLDLHPHIERRANWRDPATYPDDSFSADRWAWEFLRRNQAFRSEYRAAASLDDHALRACLVKWGVGHVYSAAEIAAHELDAPVRFKSAVDVVRRLDSPVLAQKLGFDSDSLFVHPASQTTIAFSLDLRAPIEAQLDAIRQSFADRQRDAGIAPAPKSSIQTESYAQYLRAFDGIEAGKRVKEIAEVLSREGLKADDGQVRKWINSAEKLIHDGYIWIPRITREAWGKTRRKLEGK
ncbi:transcriptional regulator domain-containing protein [Burkholderia sp. BCC1988]|uniref:transcriptional regulator domain-containing protein n=1 Tax=Burkholderia sp. BCC1988 TaxID=2817443 RepID=UPI002AAF529E|nr:DUF2285 domain-containing protein [Burkholderia sp. BCC1988]